MSQPVWKLLYATDYSRVYEDTTGVYPPEMELAQEVNDAPSKERFVLYRFCLDRLKFCSCRERHLIPFAYRPDYPHGEHTYTEWFDRDLDSVASFIGSTDSDLREALVSEDTATRAEAYEAIGSYHGYDNLDSYPLTLSEKQLNKRWK